MSDADGGARQSLVLDPGVGRGIEAGVNVFPVRSFGVQAFASCVRADVSGANTPYQLRLRYVSRPPPDYQPVPVEVSTSEPWSETTGFVQQWTLGVGPVVRRRKSSVTVVGGGGLAWLRLAGRAEPLAYTTFRLGGHSTLFREDVRVRAALGPTTILGGYVGGAIAVDVSRHVAVGAGLRMLAARAVDVASRIDAIVAPPGAGAGPEPRDVDAVMSPGPARISPQRVGVSVSVTIR